MDTCEYCHNDIDVPASPALDPRTREVRLACDRCGHVLSLEVALPLAA